jgi:hypothetical protein
MDDLESIVMSRRHGTTRRVCRVCSKSNGTFRNARLRCIDCNCPISDTVDLGSATDPVSRALDAHRIRCDACGLLAESKADDTAVDVEEPIEGP